MALTSQALAISAVLLLGTAAYCNAQNHTIRAATYTIADYDTAHDAQRTALRTVAGSIGAQILFVIGASEKLAFPLAQDLASAGFGMTSQEFGICVAWNSSVFRPEGGSELLTTQTGRFIERASFSVVGSPDTIHAFVCAFTEGTDSSAHARRIEEAAELAHFIQTLVPPVHNYPIVVGGLNTLDSSEIAPLLASDSVWQMVDPMNRIGPWHDNPAFADVHTYPTRPIGTDSGLADRFDYFLISTAGSLYKPGSITVLGNDGMHFRMPVSHQPNTSVTPELAAALERASTHLPIYADFTFKGSSGVEHATPVPLKLWLSELLRSEFHSRRCPPAHH